MLVVFALIVLAFSFENQPGPLSATLVPDAFNGPGAYGTMRSLAAQYPDRRPGSPGDDHIADYVARGARPGRVLRPARQLQRPDRRWPANDRDGDRNARRDDPRLDRGGCPPRLAASRRSADLSGTAVLLELGQVLSVETQQHSIVLASTSAQIGAAGAAQLARSLPGPVDAVIVLGDMAGTDVGSPLVVPWSDSTLVAPPLLRNTVAAALSQQVNLTGDRREPRRPVPPPRLPPGRHPSSARSRPAVSPAVLLSSSGEPPPAADEPISRA